MGSEYRCEGLNGLRVMSGDIEERVAIETDGGEGLGVKAGESIGAEGGLIRGSGMGLCVIR